MSELFAALEKTQRYDLAPAANAASVGATDTRTFAKGEYELHAREPVCIKIASKGATLGLTDLVVDPSSRPWKFALERACSLTLAAATMNQTKAWIVPLVER